MFDAKYVAVMVINDIIEIIDNNIVLPTVHYDAEKFSLLYQRFDIAVLLYLQSISC